MAGSSILARYSVPGRPLQLSYQLDGVLCEFLVMTVGERGNPGQKTTRKRAKKTVQAEDAADQSRAGSATFNDYNDRSSMPPPPMEHGQSLAQLTLVSRATRTTLDEPQHHHLSSRLPRASASRFAGFDLRPTQMQMTQGGTLTAASTAPPEGGLFVDDDDQWEPLDAQEDEAGQEENARLEYAYTDEVSEGGGEFPLRLERGHARC
jgi:cell cycle checkpoint control protein RAD9A